MKSFEFSSEIHRSFYPLMWEFIPRFSDRYFESTISEISIWPAFWFFQHQIAQHQPTRSCPSLQSLIKPQPDGRVNKTLISKGDSSYLGGLKWNTHRMLHRTAFNGICELFRRYKYCEFLKETADSFTRRHDIYNIIRG